MSSQQLLLIILGVIIVGIAVVVGIRLFGSHAINAHKQQIVSQMNQLIIEALAYKKMPASLGGGSDRFTGFAPAGSESYRSHIGSPANTGFRMITPDVNYFVELWVEGSYPQRVKIIASSKIYGEGNYWSNTYNARITASFDASGKLIKNSTLKGFEITGDWKK